MWHTLFDIGGWIFWLAVAGSTIYTLWTLDNDNDREGTSGATILAFIVGILLFSNINVSIKPLVTVISSYLFLGVVWSIFLFRYKLGYLKQFITKHQAEYNVYDVENNELKIPYDLKYKIIDDEIDVARVAYIHKTEPSASIFFDRILSWPFSVFKWTIGTLIWDAVTKFCEHMKNYKQNLLRKTALRITPVIKNEEQL